MKQPITIFAVFEGKSENLQSLSGIHKCLYELVLIHVVSGVLFALLSDNEEHQDTHRVLMIYLCLFPWTSASIHPVDTEILQFCHSH